MYLAVGDTAFAARMLLYLARTSVVGGVWGSETPSSSIPDLSAAFCAHRSGRKDFAQVV
jgi:hypothetical protein